MCMYISWCRLVIILWLFQNNAKVTHLVLDSTGAGDEGAESIGKMVSTNTYLTNLVRIHAMLHIWDPLVASSERLSEKYDIHQF